MTKINRVFWLGLFIIFMSMITLDVHAKDSSVAYYINYNNVEMSEQEYNNLLNLGFTTKQIYHMSASEFDDNKDLIGEVVATARNYYLTTTTFQNGMTSSITRIVSEEEFNDVEVEPINLIRGDGYVETTTRILQSSIIQISNWFRYKTDFEWKILPTRRSYDIIGVGLEGGKVQIIGNTYFQQTYCTSATNCTNSVTRYEKMTATGGGGSFLLPSASIISQESYLYYIVEKTHPEDTYTSLTAASDYSHACNNVSFTNSKKFYVNIGGNVLDNAIIDDYDDINTLYATWSGTW